MAAPVSLSQHLPCSPGANDKSAHRTIKPRRCPKNRSVPASTMGFPSDIFTSDPAVSCICVICHDVLEKASSLKECGHTFCDACIASSLEASASCPNCRASVTGANPSYFARDTIDGMEVKCSNWRSGEDATKKRTRCDRDNEGDSAAPSLGCEWKGQLKDLKHHEITCGFKRVKCSVDGCSHTCLAKDMEAHLTNGAAILSHMQLMKYSVGTKCNQRIKDLEASHELALQSVETKCEERVKALESSIHHVHVRYAHDCRSWIEHRPDALFHFPIYRIRDSFGNGNITGLLCGIPGPECLDWEGATIPMLFRYTKAEFPATCKFPAGFFHVNAYCTSGRFATAPLIWGFKMDFSATLPERFCSMFSKCFLTPISTRLPRESRMMFGRRILKNTVPVSS